VEYWQNKNFENFFCDVATRVVIAITYYHRLFSGWILSNWQNKKIKNPSQYLVQLLLQRNFFWKTKLAQCPQIWTVKIEIVIFKQLIPISTFGNWN
jgi:hypothetical protein